MNFEQFIAWSTHVRQQTPAVESFAETRISRALGDLKPAIVYDPAAPRVYRCDLIKTWCAAKGISTAHRTALACEGVRHALHTLFTVLAQRAERVAIPVDVYPVYGRLARDAGVTAVSFGMFPHFDLASIFAAADAAGALYVLLPCPLKLHGRTWGEEETAIAEAWLARHSAHRLILDAVYGFGAPQDAVSRRLAQTDQVIYLDSLSKGYLHAEIFGVAVVPERDLVRFTAAFRALTPNLEKLAAARQLLEASGDVPARVVAALSAKRARRLAQLAHVSNFLQPVTQGYLVPLHAPAEELLTRHSILTIPASVFGSALSDWSLASCL